MAALILSTLVTCENGELWTDSRLVAKRFGKRHSDVVRAIEAIECSTEFGERNFALTSYVTNQGKSHKQYRLTKDGFMMAAMGFTGSKAAQWRETFIAAFNAATKSIQPSDNSWSDARLQGKAVRLEATDTMKKFINYATAQGSSSAKFYYANFSKMVNSALLEIEGEKPKNLRDHLNVPQLHQLSVAEGVITKTLIECMVSQKSYKEIYQIAKTKIESFGIIVGKSKVIAQFTKVIESQKAQS